MEAAAPPGPLYHAHDHGVYEKWYLVAQQPGAVVKTEYELLESHFGDCVSYFHPTARAMPMRGSFLVPGVFCASRFKVYFGSGFKPIKTTSEEILLG